MKSGETKTGRAVVPDGGDHLGELAASKAGEKITTLIPQD